MAAPIIYHGRGGDSLILVTHRLAVLAEMVS